MLHAITNQPSVSRVTCFSVNELKVEGSLFKMFLDLIISYQVLLVAVPHIRSCIYILEERKTFPCVIFDVLEYTKY